jgi:hypothetical protein
MFIIKVIILTTIRIVELGEWFETAGIQWGVELTPISHTWLESGDWWFKGIKETLPIVEQWAS